MASPSSMRLLFVLSLLLGTAIGLEVTPGSSCSTFCLDLGNGDGFDPKASTTNTTDVTCKDLEFSTEDVGIKFKSCMECLQKSKKVNESESDLHWYLYNLRYTLSTCLFSIPSAPPKDDVDSPCVIDHACRPLKQPLTADNLTLSSNETYGYCSGAGESFVGDELDACVSCLQASGDQVYLSNFMTVLEAGCEQKPEPGELISITGTVFSRDPINITAPTEDIRDKPEGAGSSTLTTGTIVGIAVGCGLLLLGGLALFIIYWRRQKKLRRGEKAGYLGSNSGTPDPFFPPEGHKMSASLRSYSDPRSRSRGGMTAGDYYDKLEEEMGSGRLNCSVDPRAPNRGPNSALPTHEAYNPRAMSRKPPPHMHTIVENRGPSPPAPVHQRTRSNTPDSYALQTYLSTAEEPSAAGMHPPPPPPPRLSVAPENLRSSVMNMPPPPPPPPGPPPSKSSVPSLVMPSIPKLRMPKKYTPPTVTVQEPTPVESQQREIHVSRPEVQ